VSHLTITTAGRSTVFAPGDNVVVGRDPGSSVVIDESCVSRTHLAAHFDDDRWVLEDHSLGGTYDHNYRISTVELRNAATLQLGGVNGPTIVFTPSTADGLPLADATAPATTPVSGGWVPPLAAPAGSRQAVLAGVSSSFNHFWKSAPSLSTLLPIKAWWESTDWRKGSPLLFMVFGLAPWVILHSVGVNDGISKMAWGFSAYFAVLWALVMYALIRPGRLDYTLVAQIAAGGALGGIPLALALEQHFNHGSSLAEFIFTVGLAEELAKALPVFVIMFVLGKHKNYSARMFLYMGAVSGLAFGAAEAIKYSPGYIANLSSGQATSYFATAIVWRLLTDGLFHACTAAITCYFIGLAVKNPRWQVQLIAFGLGITSLLHGVNDRYSDGWSQVAIAGLLLFIFIGYVLNADRIETQVVEAAAAENLAAASPAASPVPVPFPAYAGPPPAAFVAAPQYGSPAVPAPFVAAPYASPAIPAPAGYPVAS